MKTISIEKCGACFNVFIPDEEYDKVREAYILGAPFSFQAPIGTWKKCEHLITKGSVTSPHFFVKKM